MIPILFWDEDTQRDFILPDGRLAVPGAMEILPHLRRLTEFARRSGIRIVGSVDNHRPGDAEISDHPDFQKTFPPHCMEGTPGQLKVTETEPQNPLWVDSTRQPPELLAVTIRQHDGEVLLQKQTLDVFDNPNTGTVLDTLAPQRIVVYGVATDFCVACAVEGLLKRGGAELFLVTDAVMAIRPQQGERLMESWKTRGVRMMFTDEVLARNW